MPTPEQETLAEIAAHLSQSDLAARKLGHVFVVVPHGRAWSVASAVEVPDDLAQLVGNIHRNEGVQQLRRDCVATYVEAINAAFVLHVEETVPSASEFVEVVSHLCERARERYQAEYDADLGILNRAGLHARRPDFSDVRSGDDKVWLVGFDIDHFKKINDLLDHRAGDAVLVVLADRLRRFAVRELANGWDVLVARTGGEEFTLVVRGEKEDRDFLHLLSSLGELPKESLPTPAEHDSAYTRYEAIERLVEYQKRSPITFSIGWVGVIPPDIPDKDDQFLVAALENAMRRSKDLGRNRISAFREIRKRLGRVKDHWTENGVVVLDIGTDVGVQIGDQFLVFEPEFAHGGSIVISDGRTERPIGTLPRVASALIEVFAVDREVGFATTLDSFGSSAASLKKQSVLDLYYTARRSGLVSIAAPALFTQPSQGISAYAVFVWSAEPPSIEPMTPFEVVGIESGLREEIPSAELRSVSMGSFPQVRVFRVESSTEALELSEYSLNRRFRKRKVTRYMRVVSVAHRKVRSQSEVAFANALLQALYWDRRNATHESLEAALIDLASRRGVSALYGALSPLRANGFSMKTVLSFAEPVLAQLNPQVAADDSEVVTWLQELESAGSHAAGTILDKAGEEFLATPAPFDQAADVFPRSRRGSKGKKSARKRSSTSTSRRGQGRKGQA